MTEIKLIPSEYDNLYYLEINGEKSRDFYNLQRCNEFRRLIQNGADPYEIRIGFVSIDKGRTEV